MSFKKSFANFRLVIFATRTIHFPPFLAKLTLEYAIVWSMGSITLGPALMARLEITPKNVTSHLLINIGVELSNNKTKQKSSA